MTDQNKLFQNLENTLHKIIKTGSTKEYVQLFKQYHEADIAETLSNFNQAEQARFFQQVNVELGADVLEEYDTNAQRKLVQTLKTELSAKYIENMEPDDAVDLLEELQETDEAKAEEIIEKLSVKEAEELQELLTYPENSAAAIMTTDFISIPENLNCEQAIHEIKQQQPPDTDVAFYSFITNKQQQLTSYITLRNIILANPESKIKDLRNDYPITAHTHEDQEDVAKKFQKYNLVVMPVIDDNKVLKGVITVDDIVDVVIEEATEDIYKLTGTSDSFETNFLTGSIFKNILTRLPWLSLTILGGILSASIIGFYAKHVQSSLIPLALSLSYLPLLMSLGGNIGNQSATIIVRNIATGKLKPALTVSHIFRECIITLFISIPISVLLFFLNISLFNYSILFSGIVSIGLSINMALAGLFGSSLPLVLRFCKIDPAVASAPFISSLCDIFGQIIYFSLTFITLFYFV